MNRAELRRKQKEEEKNKKKVQQALKSAGFTMPVQAPAPMRISGLTDQEVAEKTGTSIAILAKWKEEREEEIKKACILEAQEKLDRAENYITLCNIMTSLKALEGFRYGKAAALHLLDHYNESITLCDKPYVQQVYKELHEKWGLEFEFDEPDLNKEMGFDVVDWRYEYIKQHIPASIYTKIYDDATNINRVCTQIAVIWELCEEFRFHKHRDSASNKLNKFMEGCRKKYDWIEETEHGAMKAHEILKEKYEIDVSWSKEVQETIDKFLI